MGIFTKLKSLENNHPFNKILEKPAPTHHRSHNSSSSFTEGSEFSLSTSDSSYSSGDTNNKMNTYPYTDNSFVAKHIPTPLRPAIDYNFPPQQPIAPANHHRKSSSADLSNYLRAGSASPKNKTSPNLQLHNNSPNSAKKLNRIPPPDLNSMDPKNNVGNNASQSSLSANNNSSQASINQSPSSSSSNLQHPQNTYQTLNPSTPDQSTLPPAQRFSQAYKNYAQNNGHPVKEPSLKDLDDLEDEDYSSSEADTSADTSSTMSVPRQPQSHPYEAQWRQYYASMAMAQQQQQQQAQAQAQRHSMLPGSPYGRQMMNPMMGGMNPMMGMNNMGMMNGGMMNGGMMNGMNINMMPPAMQFQMLQMQQMQLQQMFMALQQQMSPNGNGMSMSNLDLAQQQQQQPTPSQQGSPTNKSFVSSYKNSDDENNGLLQQTRKSNLKSNRFPSVPLSILQTESEDSKLKAKVNSVRSNSLDLSSFAKNSAKDDDFNEQTIVQSEKSNIDLDKTMINNNQDSISPDKSIAFGLADLGLEDKEGERIISDYSKYFFDDDEDSPVNKRPNEREPSSEYSDLSNVIDQSFNSQISKDLPSPPPAPAFNQHEAIPLHESNDESGLERHGSTSSTMSYDSFQSGSSSKFHVGSANERSKRQSQAIGNNSDDVFVNYKKLDDVPKKKSRSRRFKDKMTRSRKDKRNTKPFVEKAQPPPPPLVSQSTSNSSPIMDPSFGFNNPLMNYNTEYESPQQYSPPNQSTQDALPSMNNRHQRTQSITTTDLKRKSMMLNGSSLGFDSFNAAGPPPIMKANNRLTMPPNMFNNFNQFGNMSNASIMNVQPPQQPQGSPTQPNMKSNDATISKKMDAFIKLRKVIASGNKSLEFRLKWIKMLITATNYKLYAYINIKGEPISMEQTQPNKALFVKSSVTHLLKMIKEFDNKANSNPDVYSEVCFIYGCLLKNDYLSSFNQDFGIHKDIPQAIEYLEKSIELNPSNSKAHHRLGEIFEYEFDDKFSEALGNYKESARLGYNRAIYKIAMLYLTEQSVRSNKFFNYLYDLSNIDLNSKDIELSDDDFEELEEVVGLATHELGKIYEGIYPGDLTPDDPFVQRALEKAPVNYAKSLTYYNKAAKMNCLLSQVKLGSVYEYGELNRQRNANKSIQWYIKASTSPLPFKRHPDAMLGLCRWCLQGSQGMSKHIPSPAPQKAFMWCQRAVREFQTPEAYFAMGELTEQGLGHGDPKTYYTKAYKLGHADAAAKLNL